MLKIQEIREIIKLVDQSSIEEFTYEVDDAKIKLKKGRSELVAPTVVAQPQVEAAVIQKAPVAEVAAPVQEVKQPAVEEAAPVEKDANLHEVTSPMVGTFYAASSPDAEAYVKVGDQVSETSIVCIVEAMKLFNEIEAEVSGEIVEVLAKDGQLVEYGQPLFLVKAK